MRHRTWSDDDLRAAVAASRTLSEVLARLGLARGGATLKSVRNRMLQLGLAPPPEISGHERSSAAWDADPATLRTSATRRKRSWTHDDLRAAVASSRSIAGVLRVLGLKPGGSVYVVMQRTIAELGLDTSHFTGRGWARGRKNPFNTPTRPLAEILVEGSDYLWTNELRKRLLKAGLKEPRCETCGLDEWNGLAMPLQLDHVNGDRTDNRLENLRILCPNCHAQTDTWCGKNIGARGRPGML